MNGVLLINKEEGLTSRDVVNKVCHLFSTKKVGHTGTLDPLAKGVLVVTVGKYTKLNQDLTSTYKEYVATMKLGIKTDTLDITGTILKEEDVHIDENKIIEVINSFKGVYEQEVPIYSSVKVNGKKLYEYARNNEKIDLPKREVDIKNIEVLDINDNIITFKTLVSKGTYIRSLIRDIGVSLNTCATMTDLIRTKQGRFNIEDTYTIDEVLNGKYNFLKIEDILDVEIIELNDKLEHKVINGVKLEYNLEKDYILFKKNNEEIALYKKDNEYYKMYLKM